MIKAIAIEDIMFLPAAETWMDRIEFRLDRELLGRWIRDGIALLSGSASVYLAGKVVEEAFGGVSFSAPANDYLALATTLPDDTTTGTTIVEPGYGSYARTLIGTSNNQTDAWNAATGTTTRTVTNKNAITCPTSTSSTSTIVGGAVTDAATVGNILVWFSTANVTINLGDTPKVNAGGMSHTVD